MIIDESNTFHKIINWFWRKHCRDSPCQTNSVVFSKVYMRFFSLEAFWLTGVRLWHIVSKLAWKPFKSPLSLRKWKSLGGASLQFALPLFNYHLLAQKLFGLRKILPLSQPLISRVLLKRISFCLRKKIKMLFTSLGRSVLGKLGLEYHPSTTSRTGE